MKNNNGFTLVELVIAIAVIGIIAVIGAPRFAKTSIFSERANSDKVKFLLKISQKAAMAQRRDIFIVKSGSSISACYINTTPCAANQSLTLNGKDFSANIGNTNIVLPSVKFNSLGNTETSKITIQVGSRNIYIEAESGYIHE
jgi:prepilin-type N-terminal cleavage/methylation domain-containing protein